uniref:UPF3 domain-containing protein n=1 Tax=Kalanchoe fedtschenkoi TaxID=63787 RepID=A0A7N0R8S8_KALFE
MKGPPDRTKVVVRHLPPSIPHSMIMEQIERVFGGRYNWSRFRPGKNSHKRQTHSRLYVNFERAEDVIEFAEFFNGHVFVNEKGNQFKVQVEYAPSQQVPKTPKRDGREGTIVKDPEYIEFLENLSKPVENLPSAEIQLERREADRVGVPKDAPIVTPLMDYIRQKRAAKNRPQKSISAGKVSRRSGAPSAAVSTSTSSRRGSDKKKSSTMYVQRDSVKNTKGNGKSNFTLVTKKDDQRPLEKSYTPISAAGKISEDDNGVSGANDIGSKKIVLLKGKEKEREISDVAGNPQQQATNSPVRNANSLYSSKNNQRREAGSGRIIRTLLSNSSSRIVPSSLGRSEQGMQSSIVDKVKRSYRGSNYQLHSKDANGIEDKVSGSNEYGRSSDRLEKRTRNRDRLDHGVWAPLHRSDGSHASSESLSSTSQYAHSAFDSCEGAHEPNDDMLMPRSDIRNTGSGTNSYSSYNNGPQKQFGRRVISHGAKDAEGHQYSSEGKPLKRGPPGYGSHEKQVWVQKSGSGT